MIGTDTGFEARELLFLFHPLIVFVFGVVAVAAVVLLYSRGIRSMALLLALACPLVVGLDFAVFGAPHDHSSVGSYTVSKASAAALPLLMIGVAAKASIQFGARAWVATAVTLSLALLLASPIYILWLLTFGCFLTGDCL